MVNTKLNLSMTEPYVRQIYAKQGDTGRVLEIGLEDATLENGTLRILRPDGLEKTSDAVSSDSPTITDGMASFESLDEAEVTSLKVGISPIQDLHGYASPWVGGAGKNKSSQSTLTTTGGGYINYSCGTFGSAISGQTYTLSLDNETSSTANMTVRIYNNGTQTNQVYGNLVANGRTSWTFTATVDGEIFFSGYISGLSSDQEVFKNIQLELGSSATAYAPYSNICPIYAGNGRNIWEFDNAYSITPSGTLISNATIPTPIPKGTYTLSFSGSVGSAVAVSFKKADLTNIATATFSSGDKSKTVTLTDTAEKLNMYSSGTLDITDIQLEQGSSATPYVPYQGINIYQVGKNLCPTFTSGTESGLTYTVNEDGSVHVTGTCTGTAFFAVQLTLPKGTYVLSGAPTNGQLTLRNARGGGAPSSAFSGSLDDYGNGATFTVSETASAWLNIRSTAGTHDKMYYPMIRLASETDDTYQPYLSHTYPISLGQPVYGGTLDVVGGKLYINRWFINSTWGQGTNATNLGNNTRKNYPLGVAGAYPATAEVPQLCNVAQHIANYGQDSTHFYANDIQANVFLPNGTDDSTPIQVTGELATPLEVDLTPTQITTLIGTNNMWADGQISELTFDYGKLLSVLTADQTEVVGRCLGDVNFNGASTMPFTLVVKPNNKENA